MEKKNMVLLTVIAIATLLVAVVGATFAYFTATITDNRTGDSNTKGQADLEVSKMPGNLIIKENTKQFGSFNTGDVYPGHKELIELVVNSPTDNTTDAYFDIVFKGTNTFPENTIKFQIYESKTDLSGAQGESAFKCEQKSESNGTEGQYKFFEECKLDSGLTDLKDSGHVVATKQLENIADEQTVKLNGDLPFVITGDASDKTIHFYIVVEYENKDSSQNGEDTGKKLDGNISIQMAPRNPSGIKDDESHLTEPTD